MSNHEGSPPAESLGERQTRPYLPYPLGPATMTLWLERGAWLGGMARQLVEYARRFGRSGSPSPGI